MTQKITQEGIDLVKSFEGFRATAYICPAGVPTIGYGRTKGVSASDVRHRRTITEEQATEYLAEDLATFERVVNDAPKKVALNDQQFSALVSLVYNCGPAPITTGQIGKYLKSGQLSAIPGQMLRWNRGGGRVLAGLVRRRNAEIELWHSGDIAPGDDDADTSEVAATTDADQDEQASPPASDVEPAPAKSLHQSKTMAGGIVGISALGIGNYDQIIEQYQKARDAGIVDLVTAHFNNLPVIMTTVGAACMAYMMYRRYHDREEHA